MPIPKKYRLFELEGRRVRTDRNLQRADGRIIAAGGVMTIVSAHHNLTLESEVCPHCGQLFRIHGVKRSDVSLLERHDDGRYHEAIIGVRRIELENILRLLRRGMFMNLSQHQMNAVRIANYIEGLLNGTPVEVSFAESENAETADANEGMHPEAQTD